ncbi:hypothetical protein HYW72_00455 [Candidatus Nomurabacteria bacterium]|nr:hypothetical protein [Candidatus Nomurabacteria bacterium]
MKKNRILVNGSVVLDKILEKELFGGTGANIAYGLGKLKASPILFSLAGQDFKKDFENHLKSSGVDSRVHVVENDLTARFFSKMDEKGKQFNLWRPNIYKKINEISLTQNMKINELKKVSVAIFSPGTKESILKHILEFKKINTKAIIIFDPGQEIYNFSKKILKQCVEFCDIFIVNEIEYTQAKKILEKDPRKFIKNKIIIETRGEKGSVIFDRKKMIKIPAVKSRRILDLTGAGDAYRAGLIFGLWKGITLTKACALGAKMASRNIECIGCQKY